MRNMNKKEIYNIIINNIFMIPMLFPKWNILDYNEKIYRIIKIKFQNLNAKYGKYDVFIYLNAFILCMKNTTVGNRLLNIYLMISNRCKHQFR